MAKLVLLGAMIMTLGLFTFDPIARACGKLAAHWDLTHGHHRMLDIPGHGSPLGPYFVRVLRERYAIEVDAEWFGWKYELYSYAEGYNEVTISDANRTFQTDVLRSALETAVAEAALATRSR